MTSVRMAAVVLAASMASAFAQNDPAVPAGPGAGPPSREGEEGFYRASEILGLTVRGDDGQELGKIQDLLIERRNQRVQYFLLGEGEELTAQSSLRVVPWTVARPQFRGDDRFVTVRVDQQRWRQAPSFTFQEIQRGPGAWATDVDRFYGVNARGRDVEIERDGDIEVEGRDRRDRDAERRREGLDRDRRDREVEIDRNGNVEIEGRDRPRDRAERRDGGVRVGPNGVDVRGDEGTDVRIGPNGIQINPDR